MKPLLLVLLFACCVMASRTSPAQERGLVLSIVTGSVYQRLSPDEQRAWFTGVLDGIMAESIEVWGAFLRANMLAELATPEKPKEGYGVWLGECLQRYDITQVRAVFNKRLEQQPEVWHAPAAIIARQAIVDMCRPVARPHIRGFAKP